MEIWHLQGTCEWEAHPEKVIAAFVLDKVST